MVRSIWQDRQLPGSSFCNSRQRSLFDSDRLPVILPEDWIKDRKRCKKAKAGKRVEIRESIKGKLLVDIRHREVWVWDGKESIARKWHLGVRREINSPEKIKYSLSNAPSNTHTKRLAFMQAQRYWVERPFQDAKNQCGMGEFQARGWVAWQHHMSMVMLAMLFMLEQRFDMVCSNLQ
jgi:SRSO17 transposase